MSKNKKVSQVTMRPLEEKIYKKRLERHLQEEHIVVQLISGGKLDTTKIFDPVYITKVARDMNWTPGQLNKVVLRLEKYSRNLFNSILKSTKEENEEVK